MENTNNTNEFKPVEYSKLCGAIVEAANKLHAAEYKAMCSAMAKACAPSKIKPSNQISGHMWGTDGRHYDVIAQVEVVIYDNELDYSTITGIEICDSEEPLQCNVLKVNGLHEIPRTHFSKQEIDGLESRMSEEAFVRDYSAQQDYAYDQRRDQQDEDRMSDAERNGYPTKIKDGRLSR